MYKLKRLVWLFTSWITVRLGFYYPWSRMVRWIVQHRFKDGIPALTQYPSHADLLHKASRWKWRADTWKVGWDSFSYPSHFQYMISTGFKRGSSDCDDHSLYLGHVLKDLSSKGPLIAHMEIESFDVLTVVACSPEKGLKGHNVCLVRYVQENYPYDIKFAHCSNWGKGKLYMGEYNGFKYSSIEAVVKDISYQMCGTNHENLAWGMCDLQVKRLPGKGRVK